MIVDAKKHKHAKRANCAKLLSVLYKVFYRNGISMVAYSLSLKLQGRIDLTF